jgi:hypothetical protein
MEREDIPSIREDVFKWRMDQAIRNAAKAGEVTHPNQTIILADYGGQKQVKKTSKDPKVMSRARGTGVPNLGTVGVG